MRSHPGHDSSGGGTDAPGPPSQPTQPGGRLNLLLSYAGWQPESWADRLPTLLEPLGVRSIRATNGREATNVIRAYTVHVAVVDLGLPMDASGSPSDPHARRASVEEGGPRLLEILSRLDAPPPTVVVKRSLTRRDDSREIAAALRLGAFAVIDRPHQPGDLEILLEVLRRVLHRHYRGRWPGIA